jgi:hypothetical protein
MNQEQNAEGRGQRVKKSPLLPFSPSPLVLFLFLLSSCTFLYLPPILPEQTVEPVLDLSGSSGLRYAAEKLELSVFLQTVPKEGWLAVQWFAPNNKEASSDALWIERRDAGLSQSFVLPQVPSKGEWRVVVSFGETLLRQFSLEVK